MRRPGRGARARSAGPTRSSNRRPAAWRWPSKVSSTVRATLTWGPSSTPAHESAASEVARLPVGVREQVVRHAGPEARPGRPSRPRDRPGGDQRSPDRRADDTAGIARTLRPWQLDARSGWWRRGRQHSRWWRSGRAAAEGTAPRPPRRHRRHRRRRAPRAPPRDPPRPAKPTATTIGAGCPANGKGGVPAGLASRVMGDLDGDGKPDTLYVGVGQGGVRRFGVVTASGNRSEWTIPNASPVDPSIYGIADANQDGQLEVFVNPGRVAYVLTLASCTLQPYLNKDGDAYAFSTGFGDDRHRGGVRRRQRRRHPRPRRPRRDELGQRHGALDPNDRHPARHAGPQRRHRLGHLPLARPTTRRSPCSTRSPAATTRSRTPWWPTRAERSRRGPAITGGAGRRARVRTLVDVIEAAGGVVWRRTSSGTHQGAARAPAPLRRLVAAQGQARGRRVGLRRRPPGGRGGDGSALQVPARAQRGPLPRSQGPPEAGALLGDGADVRAGSSRTTRSTRCAGSPSTTPATG